MVMPLAAIDRKLLRDLWRIRTQVAAIGLVIACGVAIMIMAFGAMRSLSDTQEAYYERYRFADVFSQAKRAPLRVVRKITELAGVASVEARIVHFASLYLPGVPEPAIGQLVSLPEYGEAKTNAILLRVGRLPTRGSEEVVMSENLALANGYQPGDQLTATISGHARTLTVVGIALSPEFIYVLGPGQLIPDNRTFGILWMDRATLEAAFDLRGAFNNISVALMPGASEAEIIVRIDEILEPYGGTGAYGRDEQLSHAFIQQELDQLWTTATLLPPIFLAVAAFLIHMIMSRLVRMERKEIGLLKAFGYTDAAVGWHYLKFGLAIAILGILVGVMVGLVLGYWMTVLYGGYFRFPFLYFRNDPAIFSITIGVTLLAVLVGTWGAVRGAVHLPPAAAMIPAPPTSYRRTIVEKLGLDRWISEPTHMIVRHIERWPFRSALTTLGIALSGAVLIGTLFFFDAIAEMIDSVYFGTNRQDATVTFFLPRSAKSIYEIAHWPGVRRAEPRRDLAVRLRNGHLSERVAISGVQPGTTLRRFLDANGRNFDIPAAGLVMSDKLADLLDVQRGDQIEVNVLEGARRDTTTIIASVVREYVGVSAYMNIDALNRLAGEGDAISGAQLLLDSEHTDEFFQAIRETPATGMVTLRAPAIAAFHETLAESMYIILSFYVSFGGAIAFGVIYNTARIALSEQSRELASLRVMGFTHGEVAYILLGELAVFVLVALPVGALLGYGLAWLLSSAMETKLYRLPFIVEHATFGMMAVVILASGAVSLVTVGRKLTQLDLVTALKAPE